MFDQIGHNHATLTTAPTWRGPNGRPGGYGGVLCTGGSYLAVPDFTNLSAGAFTIMFWLYPITWPGGFTAMIDKGTATREVLLTVDGNGDVTFSVVGGVSEFVTRAVGLTAGSWHHFAFVRNGMVGSFYRNGALRSSTGSVFDGSAAGTQPCAFGANTSTGGDHMNAIYDDIKINAGTALSADQVMAHYQASRTGYVAETRYGQRPVVKAGAPVGGNRRRRVLLTRAV